MSNSKIQEMIEIQPELITSLLDSINNQLDQAHPDKILTWGYDAFGDKMQLGTGFGPSGVFLIDRISKLEVDVPVFYLDTQLLFDETYELKEIIEERYGIEITQVKPKYNLEEQAEYFGDELWKKNPNRCCHIRKVLPLRNHLSDKSAWVTGVRRNQSETRKNTNVVEWDPSNKVVKINPLARWSSEEVWDYIHEHKLAYNPLHDDGYPSIGCIPCTFKVEGDTRDERAGRWKDSDKTECGIHVSSQEFHSE